ncbi:MULTISPECIES: AI-2E family transporter [Sellimonas]|uniref:AI-2E family transporter n=1 Tax=Sellimonas caecigallum TaxID=2592333 RepID=A0ABS7LA84_9FIRM|nr:MULTISPECIES: AI-2E family transporter [Sellimonas]MBY0759809.1 AI-2E family transporter [Sellimonas caecigallum]OUO98808.1 AI-2E family transporter [Drancourtella sp. An210]OUP62477.1 AI-2E family transporter [Drancourtella sp. An177]
MELNHENMKKIRQLIVFTALLIVCLWQYSIVFDAFRFVFGVLFPFILGGAIAFVVNVPMHFIEEKLFNDARKGRSKAARKLARPVSFILTLMLVIGVIMVVAFVVIPQLTGTFVRLGASIQAFIPKVQEWANNFFHDNKEIMSYVNQLEFKWDKIFEVIMNWFTSGAGSILESGVAAAKNIVSGFATFFIAFVFACYILLQKEKLKVQAKKVLYAFVRKGRAEAAEEVFSLTYRTFSSFLAGQCLEAVILGTMFVIAMSIFKMPYALLIGILIAFTALIPIFGAFIGCAIGAFLIFMVDPIKAFWFIIMFLVLQQIEGNLIYPHVVGGAVRLPSIWVLAAVSIGGSLMGVVGMLVFIPIVSVLYALFREIVYLKLKQNHITEEDIS